MSREIWECGCVICDNARVMCEHHAIQHGVHTIMALKGAAKRNEDFRLRVAGILGLGVSEKGEPPCDDLMIDALVVMRNKALLAEQGDIHEDPAGG
jgi:hypothetical protein